METVNATLRIDEQLKGQAVQASKIPFALRCDVPNTITLKAIKEVEDMKINPSKHQFYSDVDSMMEYL